MRPAVPKWLRWLALTCGIAFATGAGAVDRMVGLAPSDGVAMFAKRFTVEPGTIILGAQFANNDPTTRFPAVVLVRGGVSRLSEGPVVATVTDVQGTSGGTISVTWPAPITVFETESYFVGVRPPRGPGKQGVGRGPAIGATDIASPDCSYVAWGSEGELYPVRADFAIALSTSTAGGAAKAGNLLPENPPVTPPAEPLQTFLTARSRDGRFPATISFGLTKPSEVTVRVYDVAGRLLREVLSGPLAAGSYERLWDGLDARGRSVAAGIYLVRLQMGKDVVTQKLVMAY